MLCPFARKPSHSAALLLSLSGTAADIGGRPSACRISRVAQSLIHTLSLCVPQAREKMGREAKEDVEMEDDHDDVDLGADEESSVCLSLGFGA